MAASASDIAPVIDRLPGCRGGFDLPPSSEPVSTPWDIPDRTTGASCGKFRQGIYSDYSQVQQPKGPYLHAAIPLRYTAPSVTLRPRLFSPQRGASSRWPGSRLTPSTRSAASPTDSSSEGESDYLRHRWYHGDFPGSKATILNDFKIVYRAPHTGDYFIGVSAGAGYYLTVEKGRRCAGSPQPQGGRGDFQPLRVTGDVPNSGVGPFSRTRDDTVPSPNSGPPVRAVRSWRFR